MTPVHHEVRFEDAIEHSMLSSGWLKGSTTSYDRDLALDTAELFAYIGATQPREWDQLRDFFSDADEAQKSFARRVAAEIEERGVLDVLRHGVADRGTTFRLATFKPEHTLADDALEDYRKNRFTVTRQLRYSTKTPDNALDLVLFVNGIPVATAELKNPLTGQTVEDAKHQYRTTRSPTERLFQHTLVHFAVDPDLVFVATRLAGPDTQFLPFNIGTGGPGNFGSAGNPPAGEHGYRSSYLWETVWAPDTWLDMLRRFIHVAPDGNGSAKKRRRNGAQRTIIFPRYHQWHAVTQLVDHAAIHGPGHNYLVMHSAGSGKSNTIAWLAHRLAGLHSPDDPERLAADASIEPNTPVFDKVIVITDREVLDQQLQRTIYDIDHTPGIVKRIGGQASGSKSQQVADSLKDATTKIIIVTVQTFPHVLELADTLRSTRFGIVVDEAHSSQSGESSAALKKVLAGLGNDDVDDDGDLLTASVLARGRHANLSYFAFTATPKPKTLELFGTDDPTTGLKRPFHIYSMRQAIEEGFILDVIRHYLTYATYYRLASENPDNPEVDEKKAARALARFASLHPTGLSQRAEVIVEHFQAHTKDRLGGRAKAMVVTRSREHAVRQYQAIREYIDMRGYNIGALVAFSGEITIDGLAVTESQLNGVPEREIPAAFGYTRADDPHAAATKRPEFRILVVADKYQTGFDQPLLTTMYVDKTLSGVAAVQTLSRLNRTHRLKSQDDVFVLDFANEAEHILESFQPFYESAAAMPTDPNLLYTAQRDVMEFAILVDSEMDNFARALLEAQSTSRTVAALRTAHAQLHHFIQPAQDRFDQLRADDSDAADEFRSALQDYVRMYGFLAQIVPYNDTALERLYLYGKHLLTVLPAAHDGAGVDIGAVDLTHLRITQTGDHELRLDADGEQVLPGFSDGAAGPGAEPEPVPLADLIDAFNERFGTDLGEADMVMLRDATLTEDRVGQAGLANDDINAFAEVFDDVFEDKVYDRIEHNTALLKRFADDSTFRSEFTKLARRQAYDMIRGHRAA